MPKRLDYFCNTVSIRHHALAILTQLSNISDIFIEIRNNFEKNFKNVFVPFPAFLIHFIKTVFHPVSILFLCYFSCLVGDFIDYIWHRVTVFWQNFFKFLFFKIFNFLENCQYLAFGWFLSSLKIITLQPITSCEFIVLWTIECKNKFLWAKSRHLWTKFNIFWFLTPPTWPKVH